MKSKHNFKIEYEDGRVVDIHELGVWVESFHIYSPNVERELLEMRGRHGAQQGSSRLKPRKIDIGFQVETESPTELDEIKHILFSTFYDHHPYKIIRDLTPGEYLYAAQEGDYDLDNITESDAEFIITLTMLDPVIYKSPLIKSTKNPFNPFTINNIGSVEVAPIFRVTLKEPATYLDIIGANDYMRIGRPHTVEQKPFLSHRPIMIDDAIEKTSDWTFTSFNPDGAVKSGEIDAEGGYFFASKYGAGDGWHGPALNRSVGVPQPDYIVTTYFHLKTRNGEKGRTELYLLNQLGEPIAKMAAVARYDTGQIQIELNIRNGSDSQFLTVRDWKYKNDFFGYLILEKRGQTFKGVIAQQEFNKKGVAYTRYVERFSHLDIQNRFQQSLAAVAQHYGAYGSESPPQKSHIRKIIVEEILEEPEGVEYIGVAGDTFEFNHIEEVIYKNGDPFMKKDFGSRFFKLHRGINSYTFSPAKSISSIEAEWSEGKL